MSDFPAPPVPVNHVRAGPAPGPGLSGRPGRSSTRPTPATCGRTRPTRSTTSRSPTCDADALVDEGTDHGDVAGRRPALRRAGRRRRPAERGHRAHGRQGRGPGRHRPLRVVRLRLPGSRRTSRSSSTRATPTPASTPCGRAGACASSPRASSWPRPRRPSCASRPGSRRATTSTGPTSTSPTWCRPTPQTACPYKGTTSGYWSAAVELRIHPDIAWTYDFPTRELLPIAGLIAFYNEKIDLFLDGVELERPHTHLS